ncbi:MAG: flagellar biosynthetic protein FliO [Verrucomicrobiaceae bacterium]|nr:flagellar biosynthetic protein FliO [Verrucomicrobiaceae bacterium]
MKTPPLLPSFFFSVFYRARLALTLASLLPFSAYAVDAPAQSAPAVVPSPLNMVWGILFLLALVAGAWWLVRRSGGLPLQSGRGMKVIATLTLGPRERVVLIEIAGEQWLLGVAPGNVNLLHRFEQPILTGPNDDDFGSKIRAVLQQGLRK